MNSPISIGYSRTRSTGVDLFSFYSRKIMLLRLSIIFITNRMSKRNPVGTKTVYDHGPPCYNTF